MHKVEAQINEIVCYDEGDTPALYIKSGVLLAANISDKKWITYEHTDGCFPDRRSHLDNTHIPSIDNRLYIVFQPKATNLFL